MIICHVPVLVIDVTTACHVSTRLLDPSTDKIVNESHRGEDLHEGCRNITKQQSKK